MLAPTVEAVVSTSGASPVTVTVSCTEDGASCMFSVTIWPTRTWAIRFTLVKPDSSAAMA
jgi:hypothetical protein